MKKGEASNFSGKDNRNSITSPNINQRSYSSDQKNDNNRNNQGNQKKEVTKIIISPQIQNVFNNNINNIYIQNPNSDQNFNYTSNEKIRNMIGNYNLNSNNLHNNVNSNVNNGNYNSYENNRNMNHSSNFNNNNIYNQIPNRPNSVNKKDTNFSLNNINQSIDNSRSQVINNNKKEFGYAMNNKVLNKSMESQKIMQNNYISNQNILEYVSINFYFSK